jgi:hypothetical protein
MRVRQKCHILAPFPLMETDFSLPQLPAGRDIIDLIGNISIILQTVMDWMSNDMVKKVDIWTQLVLFCQLGHIQLQQNRKEF